MLQGASTTASASLLAGAAALLSRPTQALPSQALRPPGALAEADFQAACIRCGLCVRACPPHNLKLSEWGAGLAAQVPIGTPFFEARDIPCEMCEDIPCVKACPTGALDPGLQDIAQSRMGLAVLIDQESCLNFLGLRCDVCYRVCPLIDKAITLEKQSNPRSDRHAMLLPTVHAEACTGCGKCEHSCVLDHAAIKVMDRDLAQGAASTHYRKGWESQNRVGKPRFNQAEQRLPEDASKDLNPLRNGAPAYAAPASEPSP